MAYKYTGFGTTTNLTNLTLTEKEATVGAGQIQVATFPLSSGGGLDGWGFQQAPSAIQQIRLFGELTYDTELAVFNALQTIKGLQGQLLQLYRVTAANAEQWVYARLMEVNATQAKPNVLYLPVEMLFNKYSDYWQGDPHGVYLTSLDNQFALNASPKTVSISNGGNAPQRNVVIDVVAAGTPITVLRVQATGVDFTWTGSLAVGKTLEIDTGAQSVKNDGANAYSGVAWSNTIDDWLRLAVGSNSVTITKTGGSSSSTVQFNYFDANI